MRTTCQHHAAQPAKLETIIRLRLSQNLKIKLMKKAQAENCPCSTIIRNAMKGRQYSGERRNRLRLISLTYNLAEEISREMVKITLNNAKQNALPDLVELLLLPWVSVLALLDAVLHHMSRSCYKVCPPAPSASRRLPMQIRQASLAREGNRLSPLNHIKACW